MTQTIPALLAALVGGYAFSVIWNASYYHAAREDGQRLYFRAAFYAFFLSAISILLHVVFVCHDYGWYSAYLAVIGTSAATIWPLDKLPGHYGPLLYTTIPIGIVLGALLSISRVAPVLNFRIPGTASQPFLFWEKYVLASAVRDSDLEVIITRSFFDAIPLLVTLQSNKVYVGWVTAMPNPAVERRALRLLPIRSGYRNDRQELEFTTDYAAILAQVSDHEAESLDHLDLDHLEVVLPIDRISSLHFFDFVAFEQFGDSGAAGT